MTRVKSVSSPPLLLVFLVISMALAAPIIPLAETVLITGTVFIVFNSNVVWMFLFGTAVLSPGPVGLVCLEGAHRFSVVELISPRVHNWRSLEHTRQHNCRDWCTLLCCVRFMPVPPPVCVISTYTLFIQTCSGTWNIRHHVESAFPPVCFSSFSLSHVPDGWTYPHGSSF